MQRDATDQQCFSNIWVRPSGHDTSLELVILDRAATTTEAPSNNETLAVNKREQTRGLGGGGEAHLAGGTPDRMGLP